MKAAENKKMIEFIFSELSRGNDKPFLDAMAEEIQWHWMGTEQWSRTFKGKSSVLDEFWNAIQAKLKQSFRIIPQRFIADDDYVVVESVGYNADANGKQYANKHCWVLLIKEGKIHELNEYMDTALVTRVFQSKSENQA